MLCRRATVETEAPTTLTICSFLQGMLAARTVVGLARDAIWTGLAIRCMRDLGGPLPGWFVMSVGLFWLYQLLMTWLTLDIRWHFPSSDPIRAAAFVRRRLGAITLLLSAFPGALGVTAFWLTLLVRFWQR